jgi:3-isopropylmalate/(R)-2-methylmalate dehydratase small subunit
MLISGKVWKYPGSIAAQQIVSSKYDKQGMSAKWAECVGYLLEDVDPDFSSAVRPGDMLLVERHLGNGHAHYYMTAIMTCRQAGITALLSESINPFFQHLAIDNGLPAWGYPGLAAFVRGGDVLQLDLASGAARNLTLGTQTQFAPLDSIVLDILAAGGSTAWALGRIGWRQTRESTVSAARGAQ